MVNSSLTDAVLFTVCKMFSRIEFENHHALIVDPYWRSDQQYYSGDTSLKSTINPLKPTVAIWVQL